MLNITRKSYTFAKKQAIMGTQASTNKYGYWDTVAEYLPHYHTRNDVLLSDILVRYIDDEEVCESDLKMIESEYGTDKQAVKEALFRLDSRLIIEAMRVMYDVKE